VTSPDPSTVHRHPPLCLLVGRISMMPAWNGREESKQPKASRLYSQIVYGLTTGEGNAAPNEARGRKRAFGRAPRITEVTT